MVDYAIPPELIAMLQDRRVIPFIGAGFSSSMGLPGWEHLLERVASEVDDSLAYSQVRDMCNGDVLQIAEYLFLKADKNIGPLRQGLSTLLHPTASPLTSTVHVELVNLGAPRVYTTNFDNLIERAYKELGYPIDVIVLPKHVALSRSEQPQVVKYHGDLKYETTLVLTESSYYSRLELDSPMDLKFRSDLLGRSVLFMGYSFRDINIRIIWFKLMEIMQDIPPDERPTSYIVRFDPNEVLDALYEAVGIRTIVLDPDRACSTDEQRNDLFAQFMLDLSRQITPKDRIPGTTDPMFISRGLISFIQKGLDQAKEPDPKASADQPIDFDALIRLNDLLPHLGARRLTPTSKSEIEDVLFGLARISARHLGYPIPGLFSLAARVAITHLQVHGRSAAVTTTIARALCRESGRSALQDANLDWSAVWSEQLEREDAEKLVEFLEYEVHEHEDYAPDDDIAYTADIARRIANGQILADEDDVRKRAEEFLERAADIYSAISTHEPSVNESPDVSPILEQIHKRREKVGTEPSWEEFEPG